MGAKEKDEKGYMPFSSLGRKSKEANPAHENAGTQERALSGGALWWLRARGRGAEKIDKSSKPRLNLSGSWQQGHSAAYNTPFLIQVVCKGFIGPGP